MKLNCKNKNFIGSALLIAIVLALLLIFRHEGKNRQKNLEYQFSLLENWSIGSTSGSESYVVNLIVKAANENNVIITNFSNMGISVKASLINNELKIDSQNLNIKNEIIYVKGTGWLNSNTLNIQYSLIKNNSVFTANCEGILVLNSTKFNEN